MVRRIPKKTRVVVPKGVIISTVAEETAQNETDGNLSPSRLETEGKPEKSGEEVSSVDKPKAVKSSGSRNRPSKAVLETIKQRQALIRMQEEEEQRQLEEEKRLEEERLAEMQRLEEERKNMKKELVKKGNDKSEINRIKLEQMIHQGRTGCNGARNNESESEVAFKLSNLKMASTPKDRRVEHEEMVADEEEEELKMRSPICCVLGHVDTGKTKLLDKIRHSNIQGGEAGGITQQIGATYFPIKVVKEKTKSLQASKYNAETYELPGLLIIDTPGHESFSNLRSRGSSLCNIAILVVDIMHGLEPQTIESINLLKRKGTPFIVALNKVDKLYGWKTFKDEPFIESIKKQPPYVISEFEDRLNSIKLEFSGLGLNTDLYYNIENLRKNVSMVPTSAISGEGIPDLLSLIVTLSQEYMKNKLRYSKGIECTILEVKVVEGLGTTIDVILSNGTLREGDAIAMCGINGPIVTYVKALLTPETLREMRDKNSTYVHNEKVKGALGVKILAPGLEKAIAGSRVQVIESLDNRERIEKELMEDVDSLFCCVDNDKIGVYVQSSTLGSLEALISFLRSTNIPISFINIGPIHKKDVVKASAMIDTCKEYACILSFDVKIEKDAQELAKELGVKIFRADIIYHLFDQFTAYINEIREKEKQAQAHNAIFPCIIKIIPEYIFNKKIHLFLGWILLKAFSSLTHQYVSQIKAI